MDNRHRSGTHGNEDNAARAALRMCAEEAMFCGDADRERLADDAALRDLIDRYCPGLWQERMDLAERVGVDPSVVLALTLATGASPTLSGGCTTIVVTGRSTGDGRAIVHKTRDNCRTYRGSWWLARPRNGYAYLASSTVGDGAVAMGINAAGLTIATSSSATREQHRRGVSARAMARRALEHLDSVASVPHFMRGVPRAEGSNMVLADVTGAAMTIEATSHRLAVDVIHDGWRVRTNHFLDLAGHQERTDAAAAIERSSIPRYDRCAEVLASHDGLINATVLAELSRDHHGIVHGMPWGGSLCSHGAMWSSMTAGQLMPSATYPEVLSMAWASAGYPCAVPYLPLYVGMECIPTAFGDGRLADAADRAYAFMPPGTREQWVVATERAARAEAADVEREAQSLLHARRRQRAVDLLTSFSYRLTDATLARLDALTAEAMPPADASACCKLIAPGRVLLEELRGDRMLRFEIHPFTHDASDVVATLDGVPDAAIGRFPERIEVRDGRAVSGLLMIDPAWNPAVDGGTVRLEIRDMTTHRLMAGAPLQFVRRVDQMLDAQSRREGEA